VKRRRLAEGGRSGKGAFGDRRPSAPTAGSDLPAEAHPCVRAAAGRESLTRGKGLAGGYPTNDIRTRIQAGPDHRISGIAPFDVPPGEHEATISAFASACCPISASHGSKFSG